MNLRHHFFQYSLTTHDVAIVTITFSTIWLVIGCTATVFLRQNPKRLGWVISLVNSFVLMVVGAVYSVVKIPTFNRFWWFGDNGRALFHSVDNVAVLVCIWFVLANISDILFGLLFYRQYLDPLTAYAHHTVYVWLLLTAITGNGGFATFEPFATGIVYMFVEEVPTFLLAFGAVFPSCRTDVGFGVTFFSLRLVYHAYMLLYSLTLGVDTVIPVMFCLTFILHMYWFHAWMRKYGWKLILGGGRDKVDERDKQGKAQ